MLNNKIGHIIEQNNQKVQINQAKILPQANIQTKYLINQAIQKESQPQKIVNSQSQQKSMQSSSTDHTKNNPLKPQTNQGPIEQQQEQYQFQQDLPSMQFQINFEQQQPKGQEKRSSLQNDMINTKMEKKELFKEFADDWRQSGNYRESGKFQGETMSNRYSRKVEHNLRNGEFVFAQDSDLQKDQSNAQDITLNNQTNQSTSEPQQQPNLLQTNTQPAKSTFLSLSQFQSQHRLYQEYQPHNDPQSSSESESSLDSEASFAKMNARRTMLLSDDFYGMNQYMTIANQLSSQQCKQAVQCCRKINNLQSLLKRETILLEFQEKTKNERIKQIQYSYVNAFNNFLVLRNLKTSKTQTKPILLNAKDLYQIHQEFLDDLRRIKQALGNIILPQEQSEELQLKKTLSSSRFIPQSPTKIKNFGQLFQPINPSTLPPPQTFLIDFNNFFPNWPQNIYHLMQLEFQSHQRIESTFQSEYSIPSKIFSSIKYRDNIMRFCEMIFQQPLRQLKNVKEELIVDYANIYEKWASTLFNIPNSNPLKQFMEGRYMLEDTASRNAIVPQISKFFGEKMDPSEYEKLLIELNHFAKNRNAMNFLFNEIGRQEIQGQSINLRLALLVYKKMQINRRKLQQLALLFINQIIDNYPDMPLQIKYIVQLFKHFSKQKLIQQNLEPVIKYQDLKSFFNKIIFSQLFFLTFMQLVDEQGPNSGKEKSSTGMNSQGHNITMIALIAQKIMFGQEFYERFKYGYFNSVIKQYAPKIKSFIENFAQTQTIRFEQPKEIQFTLLSLQSVKYLYLVLKQNEIIQPLVSFQTKLLPTLSHHPFSLGSSRYTLQKMYLMLTYKPEFNYTAVFRPKDKFRRTFIEFLMLIESINDGVTFRQVLEQYKCMQEDNHQGAKPSVQIYANYLSGYEKIIQSQNLVQDIQLSITKTKAYIEKVKIFLQREHNISMNLEHMYQTLLVQKKKLTSTELLEDYINLLFNLPLQFDYFVHDGKICENESTSSKKKQRIIKDCLNDVADFFGKGLEGLDGLYSLLIEKIIEEVEKQGVVDENMIETAQSIIGEKLYKMVKLGTVQTEKDKKLFNSMKRHKFLNLKMLALPQYIDEQEIILQLSLQILERLKHPMSPDRMMQCFYEVSIVFQNVITCVGKASDITSDVQIPLMQLVLVKSMIPNLNSILEFIKTFSHNQSGSNKYAMILALVESICYLIQNMDAEHLGISQAQYVGYIQNEYVIVD